MFDTWEVEEIPDVEPLPAGLVDMAPGSELAALLATVDPQRLSDHDRVILVQAHDRMVSYHQAQRYAAMAAVLDTYEAFEEDADSPYWSAGDGAATEIRAALRLTRRAADDELSTAVALHRRLPDVWQAMCDGRIDLRRGRVIVDGTSHLDDTRAAAIATAALEHAATSTTGQLRARMRRLCITVDPDDADRRYTQTLTDRRIEADATVDGTANLYGFNLEPHRVAAIRRWIHRQARAIKTDDEPRTLTQICADIFMDLLEHRCTATGRPGVGTDRGVVDITVDLATLTGLVDAPGDLGGYGPVIADIARKVASAQTSAGWRYTVIDDGRPVATGITRRRPTAAHRRLVEGRDRRCIFPGCRMPATSCDIDHTTPWAVQPETSPQGTAPLCRHDHIARHHGWRYHRTADGTYRWTSPLGHTYTTSRGPP